MKQELLQKNGLHDDKARDRLLTDGGVHERVWDPDFVVVRAVKESAIRPLTESQ